MEPEERRAQLKRAEADLLADERARFDESTPSERLRESVAMCALTVAELSRRCANDEDLVELLAQDPAIDLTARWRATRHVHGS